MNISSHLSKKVIKYLSELHIKPENIHGINPLAIDNNTGKSVELPRFCSVEMLQARTMNKIAVQQSKNPIIRAYTKASSEDLKRLTSETIGDSFARAEWTNPKDGKIYNILKEGETEDGKILVKILDSEGGFIKNAKLTPKTILIPDNYSEILPFYRIPHGDIVLTYARRNNPFAKYVRLSVTNRELEAHEDLAKIVQYLDEQGVADYISCSYGLKVGEKKKFKIPTDLKELLQSESTIYDKLITGNRRVLFAADNASYKEYNNSSELSNLYLCANEKVEGVGSLCEKRGKVAPFSISRNSELTQHYELGEFTPKLTKFGINITGLPGTDIPLLNTRLEKYLKNPLLGKPVDRIQDIIKDLNNKIKYLEQEKYALFKSKESFKSLLQKRSILEEKISIYSKRKRKILSAAGELVNIRGEYNIPIETLTGTSFSTPIRTAKLALNDMMEGII